MDDPAPLHRGLSVVIPTLDEEDHLPALLSDLARWGPGARVVVADGGSRDGTRSLALDRGCRVVFTPPGRGRQMNAGARLTETPWLLFLHADSRLDRRALEQVDGFTRENTGAACFRLAIDHPARVFRWIEFGQRLRQRWLGLPYGDQGLLVSRSLFERLGGFPDVPIMEDVLFVRHLAEAGHAVTRLSAPVRTSPRRYLEAGPLRQVARNAWRLGRWSVGVSPERLARSYSPRRLGDDGRSPQVRRKRSLRGIVCIFAKAPRAGQVKTRLAAGIGEEAALRVYRHLLQATVREAQASGEQAVICYDPRDGRPELARLLDIQGAPFRFQGDGDLGQRMDRMLTRALQDGAAAVVIGTDIPALDRDVLSRAFLALEEADVVLGPSLDGGYYLLGLTRPAPELFDGIAWSQPTVLDETRARIGRAGMTLVELEPLLDVDRAEDLTDGLREVAGSSGSLTAAEVTPDPRPHR